MSQEKDSRQYIKIRGANEHNLKNRYTKRQAGSSDWTQWFGKVIVDI